MKNIDNEALSKKLEIGTLNEIYGPLLTDNQREILTDYYNNDLSLSEIAENNNISRQAVQDIIKKGEKKLFDYEEKLKFMEKTREEQKHMQEILTQLTKIEGNVSDENITKVLTLIKKELSFIGQ